jgi:hypothetical protein
MRAIGDCWRNGTGLGFRGGFFHPLTTRPYFEEVSAPALQRGWNRAITGMNDFVVVGAALSPRVETTSSPRPSGTKAQVACYGLTPAQRSMLDLRGWGDPQPQLAASPRSQPVLHRCFCCCVRA